MLGMPTAVTEPPDEGQVGNERELLRGRAGVAAMRVGEACRSWDTALPRGRGPQVPLAERMSGCQFRREPQRAPVYGAVRVPMHATVPTTQCYRTLVRSIPHIRSGHHSSPQPTGAGPSALERFTASTEAARLPAALSRLPGPDSALSGHLSGRGKAPFHPARGARAPGSRLPRQQDERLRTETQQTQMATPNGRLLPFPDTNATSPQAPLGSLTLPQPRGSEAGH